MGLFDIVGNTPMVELDSLSKATGCRILAKAEYLNPGGSIKDRAARSMILDAEAKGLLDPQNASKYTIVEASGGNTALALALFARVRGYHVIVTMPESISPEKINMCKRLGAQVVLCPLVPFSDTEKHYYHTAERMARETPGAFFTNQFESDANRNAHIQTTGPEIFAQTGGKVDGFVCSAGTGGTIGGVSSYLKAQKPSVQTFIADPPGSGHFNYVTKGEFTVTEGSSYTEGIGIARLTANFAAAKLDGAIFVTDAETAQMVQYLIENEGLVVGPSAALNVVAAVKVGRILKAQRNADVNEVPTVVTVICDSGERYQRKVFDTQWLSEKGLYFQNVSNELEWIL